MTSVLSLSTTAVDVLFLRNARGGEVNIDVGIRKAKVNENSAASYAIGVILSSLFIVLPKLVMYSWTIAMFRWRAIIFFSVITFFILIANFLRRTEAMCSKRVKKSFVSTVIGVLGVEENQNNSVAILSILSTSAILLLSCALPYSGSKTSFDFNSSSVSYFYRNDIDLPENFCICRKLSSDLLESEKQFFKDGIVCQRMQIDIQNGSNYSPDLKNTSSRCYDEIFFKIPLFFSIVPLEKFPDITICVTFDGIRNYVSKIKVNIDLPEVFDKKCNATLTQMFVPCSETNLIEIKVVLSILIAWMCCSLALIKMSTRIGEALFSMKWKQTGTNLTICCGTRWLPVLVLGFTCFTWAYHNTYFFQYGGVYTVK